MALVQIPASMRFILITLYAWQEHPEGHVAIMGFDTMRRDLPNQEPYEYPATPENIEAEIAKAQLPFKSWRIVDYSELPQDRTYRNALKDNGDSVGHDMDRAKAIYMDNLRLARADTLLALDRDWMRAVGQGNTDEAASVEAERQRLRDLPDTVDLKSAQTVADLMAQPIDAVLQPVVQLIK